MKTLAPVAFDLARCRTELDTFRALLDAKANLSERTDLLPLFRRCPHLTAFIGTLFPDIGPADRLGYEFSILGDFAADIVIGNSRSQVYCAVELEDARPDSLFRKKGARATAEWAPRLEHGFGQLVDWFFAWDDTKGSAGFAKHFGYGHVEFFGLLLIGRSAAISAHEQTRLRWRSGKVTVNSHKVYCRTYDDVYESLDRTWQFYNSVPAPPPAKT